MATVIATESRDTAAVRRGGTCRRYSPHADVLAVGQKSMFTSTSRVGAMSAVAAARRASAMAVVSVATALLLTTAMDARAQLAAIDASCTGGRFARVATVCDTQPDGASAVGGDDENGAMENDNRQNLLTSAYLGTAIDNFAGSEILTYLNPEDAGPTGQRPIFGFNFEFRLTGDRDKPTKPTNSQLWLYGETLHGVRSRDVECPSEGQAPVVCGDLRNEVLFPELDDIPERAAFILKNATSFEGYVGLRWEFLGINQAEDNQPDDTAAALYLKAQAGLLAIAPNEAQKEAVTLGAGSDSVDNHVVAVGVIATNGKMSGSYVEAGFGRTDLFFDRSSKRWKVDALLSFSVAQDWVRPFAQIVVDSDFGRGSDSIQSFFGIDFDAAKLFAF